MGGGDKDKGKDGGADASGAGSSGAGAEDAAASSPGGQPMPQLVQGLIREISEDGLAWDKTRVRVRASCSGGHPTRAAHAAFAASLPRARPRASPLSR